MKILPKLPIYFYDDRGKSDVFFEATKVLYTDDNLCICLAESRLRERAVKESFFKIKHSLFTEKFVFDYLTGEVLNVDYAYWYGDNTKLE